MAKRNMTPLVSAAFSISRRPSQLVVVDLQRKKCPARKSA